MNVITLWTNTKGRWKRNWSLSKPMLTRWWSCSMTGWLSWGTKSSSGAKETRRRRFLFPIKLSLLNLIFNFQFLRVSADAVWSDWSLPKSRQTIALACFLSLFWEWSCTCSLQQHLTRGVNILRSVDLSKYDTENRGWAELSWSLSQIRENSREKIFSV